jgi:uncharacterized membrane protein
MAMLGWVMMGLAIWHFTIWVPDRFWGGIVGAFVGALLGAVIFGVIIASANLGVAVPGERKTDIAVILYAVPGALIGIGAAYLEGIRREARAAHDPA